MEDGFWHEYVHTPPLSKKPNSQEFLNALASTLDTLTDADWDFLYLQWNVKDQTRSDEPLIYKDLDWARRIELFLEREKTKYLTREPLTSTQLIERCDTVLAKIHQYIVALPKRSSNESGQVLGANDEFEVITSAPLAIYEGWQIANSSHSISSETIELMHTRLREAARTYNWTPPSQVVRNLRQSASQLTSFLSRPLSAKSQTPVLILNGQLFGLYSYAAMDLGQLGLAEKYAEACVTLGKSSGSPNLQAWAFGTLSLIQRINDDNSRALQSAERGLLIQGARGEKRSRLLSSAGECAANLGYQKPVTDYLAESETEFGEVPSSEELDLPGIFVFPPAKVPYYAASALLEIEGGKKTLEQSAQASLSAISAFGNSSGPDQSYPDMLVAQVHLARARLRLNDLDGVLDALHPLTLSPPEMRTSWHEHYLRRIAETANKQNYKASGVASQIRIIATEFLTKW